MLSVGTIALYHLARRRANYTALALKLRLHVETEGWFQQHLV